MLAAFLHTVKRIYSGVLPECVLIDNSYEFRDGMSLFELTIADDCTILICKDTCSPETCTEYENVSLNNAAILFVVEFLGKKRKGATYG